MLGQKDRIQRWLDGENIIQQKDSTQICLDRKTSFRHMLGQKESTQTERRAKDGIETCLDRETRLDRETA